MNATTVRRAIFYVYLGSLRIVSSLSTASRASAEQDAGIGCSKSRTSLSHRIISRCGSTSRSSFISRSIWRTARDVASTADERSVRLCDPPPRRSKFELWVAHMASFVSSYTLAVGYVILLYFVGKVRSEVLPQSRDFASGTRLFAHVHTRCRAIFGPDSMSWMSSRMRKIKRYNGRRI